MKKIINTAELVEQQMIDGMIKAYPNQLTRLEDEFVILRKQKKTGKVALISGGGSGHEPAHGGYVGYGMLDGAVAGPVFTSPSVDPIYKGIKAVDGGAGVLMVIKNYTGDVMNFELAGEQAEEDGVQVAKVIVCDDVAVENSTWTTGRRGVAGTVFVHKIAGALAETGAPLDDVQKMGQKVADNVRTMGMAIKPCTVPAAGVPGFQLEEDEIEIGIGIHGEPGVKKGTWEPADQVTDQILEKILADIDYTGSEVAVMVNGCGGTPIMELFIVNNRVQDVLKEKGIRVHRTYVGNYMTSLEMEGFSVSLLRLDEEMKALLDAPADTPAFVQTGTAPAENASSQHNTPKTESDAEAKEAQAEKTAEKDIFEGAEVATEEISEDAEVTTAESTNPAESGNGIGKAELLKVITAMADAIEKEKLYLTELDNVIGDGDHGINMARGFQAVMANMDTLQTMDCSGILTETGKILMKTVGGSSGPLYGTAFRKAGGCLKNKGSISLGDFVEMLEVSIAAIMKLGKSTEGEKTMLDAIGPALRALQKAVADAGDSLNNSLNSKDALLAAVNAAEEGVAYTKGIAATKGRASYLGERSIGHEDPGAVSFTLILKTIAETVA
ncbi:MAG: dihydroxyacetone kinase subunit DhaK [Lachnospiraceae bacterium]|nr:dihydroxyacetone kinase subunit DhaK [Lachnospiraceae bacterium]